jgi:hypothetical protein
MAPAGGLGREIAGRTGVGTGHVYMVDGIVVDGVAEYVELARDVGPSGVLAPRGDRSARSTAERFGHELASCPAQRPPRLRKILIACAKDDWTSASCPRRPRSRAG